MISSSEYIKGGARRFFAGQDAEFSCFIPSKVNREFLISNKISEHSEEATRLIGELNAYSLMVPDIDFFISMHERKEAVQSTRIEGTFTDIDDAVLSEADVSPEKRDNWREVQNYMEALRYSIRRLDELPLTMRLLNEAHKILLQGTRGDGKTPGQVRTSQNWIGGASLRSATFIPPHADFVPTALSDLEHLWHSRSIAMPKLIRIAVTHYQFETIHPYADGNGRIGRLLIMLQMMNYGMMTYPTLYMSDFFEKNRQAYYNALMEVRINHNLDHWLAFFLDGVIATANSSKEKFKKIMALRDEYKRRTFQLGRRATKADTLIEALYANPVVSVSDTAKIVNLSQTNANLLINELVDARILKELTGYSRNRLFVLDEYLAIFRS